MWLFIIMLLAVFQSHKYMVYQIWLSVLHSPCKWTVLFSSERLGKVILQSICNIMRFKVVLTCALDQICVNVHICRHAYLMKIEWPYVFQVCSTAYIWSKLNSRTLSKRLALCAPISAFILAPAEMLEAPVSSSKRLVSFLIVPVCFLSE